jgi:Tfp pilus assembly protein PilN
MMKKQINLYQPNCYPKREKATFPQFLMLFFICVSTSIFVYFFANNQTNLLNEQLSVHKISISEQQLILANLVSELQNKRAPDNKLRMHSALQNEVKAKQRLLASLSGIDLKESVSFSSLMRGLSYSYMPDITINHFSMVGATLNITGEAKHSDSVPLWLSNIQLSKELSSISFKALSINENKGFFSFQLMNSDFKGTTNE